MNGYRINGPGTQWNISHGKQWNPALWGTTNEPGDNHKSWGKSESKRFISYDITYRRYLITDTNEHNSQRNTLTNLENQLCSSKGKGGGNE